MTFELKRYSLTACLAVLALSGCGGVPSAPSGTLEPMQRIQPAFPYQILYRFPGVLHGRNPVAPLIHVNGTLYGTTPYGGSGVCGLVGCGTVFAMNGDGSAKVLYNFAGGSDGAFPKAGLLNVNGTLYGTTAGGGDSACPNGRSGQGCGTVYSVTVNGSEKVLHRFHGGSDGAYPSSGLVQLNGTLYGTTTRGDSHGCGTVYGIRTSGALKVVADFCSRRLSGYSPQGDLVAVNGALYGTTSSGGSGSYGVCGGLGGCGLVYRVNTNGSTKVLYNFTGGSDGQTPYAGLVNAKGMLYGTTWLGGDGYGTVYSISTAGSEKVIYRFTAPPDGNYPQAPLINVNGTLYGTTPYGGGAFGCYKGRSCGTLFSVNLGGKEKILHRFAGGLSDGGNPYAGLTILNGTLYGTTSGGGIRCDRGRRSARCGTVFALSP